MLFNRNCGCNQGNSFNRVCGCNRPEMESPVMEPVITKCVQRDFYHEVPQE